MIKQLRRRQLLLKKEKIIRSSGLFSETYYRTQLQEQSSAVRNAIRHYLIRGERMGLSPMPLFDKEWYVQEYPDVAIATQDYFLHFVEHGEREHRSPHPLFDAVYYQSQTNERIHRPLTHFLSGRGRAGLDPHPLIRIDRLTDRYGSVLPAGTNPLIYFLQNKECEDLVSEVFSGEHYAAKLGEPYAWPRHGLVQFLKHARQENVSPHPDVEFDAYLKGDRGRLSPNQSSFAQFILSRHGGGADRDSLAFPLRGEKLVREFEGTYDIEVAPVVAGACRPTPVAASVVSAPAASIAERYANAQADLNGRFRLDHAPPLAMAGADAPVISILMPVFRPPLVYLDRAIRSVLQQSFSNWELCLVDDGSNSPELTVLLQAYAASDARVKVAIAQRNGGISRASNAALGLASGSYVALLDNDDMLTVDAVETVTRALADEPDLDFLYSDECLIDENDLAVRLFSKPDWSPVLLYACMYSGHFTTYRKTVVESVGGFRPEFDFSQDYDLALRISDINPRVRHLSAYLYGWRLLPGSATQGGKPFARLTNVAALQDTLERRQYPGKALGYPVTNVIVREQSDNEPKVSIIVPSDNLDNIVATVTSILDHTDYPNVEILVVTNTSIIAEIRRLEIASAITCVPYDRPFNFSDKCNVGAEAATGQFLVFYNDDVRVISPNWLYALLDVAVLDDVGAVAPKLLYENGLIQHAGMVTGVRRLVGTAFHTYPSETSDHFGMAQYPREVSLLCGACVMVKTEVYRRIGGFDAHNAPINHSDVDLCFRIRECGLSCVYVSTASLKHIGHVSIGKVEAEAQPRAFTRDKADIFLLKRWMREISYDPYFPPAMRDILYLDSQEPFHIFPGSASWEDKVARRGSDILLVSHDLSNSGAPKIVLDLARILLAEGHYVCVLSPADGPMRARLNACGADVIVDALALTRNSNVFDFAKNFDFAIANTVVTWTFVKQMGAIIPVYWYIHEGELVAHYANVTSEFIPAFQQAAGVWVGSGKSGRYLAHYGIEGFEVVPYGIEETAIETRAREQTAMVVGLFGSFEPRKGQDLAVLGMMSVPEAERRAIELRLFGRILDKVFYEAIRDIAGNDPSIVFGGELTPEAYLEELAQIDVLIVPSRDDTLPLVSLDALAASKVVVVSTTTGTSEWLEHGRSAFVLEHNSPDEIGETLRHLSVERERWIGVGSAGRACFDENFSWDRFTARIVELIAAPRDAAAAVVRSA